MAKERLAVDVAKKVRTQLPDRLKGVLDSLIEICNEADPSIGLTMDDLGDLCGSFMGDLPLDKVWKQKVANAFTGSEHAVCKVL